MPGNSEMRVFKNQNKKKNKTKQILFKIKSYPTFQRFLLENDDHFRQTTSRQVYLQEAEQNSLEAFANFW